MAKNLKADSTNDGADGDLESAAKRPNLRSAASAFPEPTSSDSEQVAWTSRPPALVEVPKNTQKNDSWAMSTLTEWMTQRNNRCSDSEEKCPENLLETDNAESLSRWLSLFIIEVRKQNGNKYPPSSLYSLLCSFQRIMKRYNPKAFSIFETKDVRFQQFHRAMANIFQALRSEGIVKEVRHVTAITSEEEVLLWQRGILGDTSPLSLVRSVFFLNGKNFCLGGGREHRDLRLSQFTRRGDHWEFVSNRSKPVRLGGTDVCKENSVFRQYPSPAAGRACHFYLLDLYFSKLLPYLHKDAFYFTPAPSISPRPFNQPWYTYNPIGVNKLDRMVKDMFEEAGIGWKTNRSLKMTGMAEKLITKSVPILYPQLMPASEPGLEAQCFVLPDSSQVSPLHNRYANEGNAENPINLDGEGIVTEEASTSTSIDAEECSKARERQASFETEQLPTSIESISSDQQCSSGSDNVCHATTHSVQTELIEHQQQSKEGLTDEREKSYNPSVNNFTTADVIALLEAKGLQQYREVFEREHIDGEILQELDDEILEKELGVTSKLHRIRIMKLGRDLVYT